MQYQLRQYLDLKTQTMLSVCLPVTFQLSAITTCIESYQNTVSTDFTFPIREIKKSRRKKNRQKIKAKSF